MVEPAAIDSTPGVVGRRPGRGMRFGDDRQVPEAGWAGVGRGPVAWPFAPHPHMAFGGARTSGRYRAADLAAAAGSPAGAAAEDRAAAGGAAAAHPRPAAAGAGRACR